MAQWPVPVRLEYATAQEWSEAGVSDDYLCVRVKVQNVSPVKTVKLHYRAGPGWVDVPLGWESNYVDHDIFTSNHAPYTNEFVISYLVDGVTYWDDNGSRNYQVPNFKSALGGGVVLREVKFLQFGQDTTALNGTLYVENLSYEKTIGIRFSGDGGKTWADSGAAYSGLASEGAFAALGPIEQWEFSTPILNAENYIFAAYYNNLETGEWFWDNNFGQNYLIADEPEIE